MAWDFGAEISALSGFDADYNVDISTGETYRAHANQWLTQGAKEIINILPRDLKMECSTMTALTSTTPMDLDASGPIFHVTRENADSGYYIGCREINPIYADSANDSTSLHYATATDPVYWTESNSSGNPTLFVKPTPTATQPAKIMHVSYPTFTAADGGTYDVIAATSIANFPDEAEHLVVLRAAIAAAEYMLAIEEDPEIFIPMIQNLRKEYNDGLSMLISQSSPKESKKLGDIQV